MPAERGTSGTRRQQKREHRILVRLDRDLATGLKTLSQRERRSMNAQLVVLVDRALRDAGLREDAA